MKQRIYEVDSVDGYNKWYGVETLHPLVTVLNIKESPEWLNGATLRYGLYGIFLKQGAGCSVRYGREKYDYQEGTIVTHAPGEVFTVEWNKDLPMPPSRGLLFHPDLLYGTPLGLICEVSPVNELMWVSAVRFPNQLWDLIRIFAADSYQS